MRNASNIIKALQFIAAANGDDMLAHRRACSRAGPNSGVATLLKSWASATGDISPDAQAAYRELLQLSNRRSLVGKIQNAVGFRRVPVQVPVLEQQPPGHGADFIQDGGAYPAGSNFEFNSVSLTRKKIGSIVPFTAEMAKLLDASSAVSRDLIRAIAISEGENFFSTSAATDAAPAGIANDLTPETGSNDPEADIFKLVDEFEGDPAEAVLITSTNNGIKLAALYDSTTGAQGGTVAGITHVTSKEVPDAEAALIEPGRILLADDGLEIDFTSQADLGELDSSGDLQGEMVSLWQCNCVAYRVTRWLNWRPAPGSVVFMNQLDW